jgi:hypothetical protein
LHATFLVGYGYNVSALCGAIKKKVVVSLPIIGTVQLLSCEKAIRKTFAIANHILSINAHGRAIVGGMVGTTGFEGIIAVQTGFYDKSAPSAHSIVAYIYRIPYGVQSTVEWKV